LTVDALLQFCVFCITNFMVWKCDLHLRCHLSRLLLQRPVLQF